MGYLESVRRNLRVPLSASAAAELDNGGGSELHDSKGPAKMRALHSSAALAVNVFDHWMPDNAVPLLEALGIDGTLASPPRFEAQFPTGLPGMPPNLDVALTLTSGTVIGIESKFTEWLTRKRASRPAFKDKYFASEAGLWARNGLPDCQALAADMMSGAASFRHLDAAQLLKHALGLSTKYGGRFALYYVFCDVPCPAAARHAQEIARFDERVRRARLQGVQVSGRVPKARDGTQRGRRLSRLSRRTLLPGGNRADRVRAPGSSDMADCLFCGIEPSRVVRDSALTVAFWDAFPVSAGSLRMGLPARVPEMAGLHQILSCCAAQSCGRLCAVPTNVDTSRAHAQLAGASCMCYK